MKSLPLSTMRAKIKNIILAIVVTAIAIILPAWLLNKWVEGIIFFVCHWLIREQFKEQYHHIIPAVCRVITGAVFFFGICFVCPITVSLISAIPINYLIGWVGFTKKQADTYEVKYNALREQLEADSKFNIETCTTEELIERCRELKFTEENIDFAIEFFIKKTSRKVLAEKHYISEDAVKQKKRRMRKILNAK